MTENDLMDIMYAAENEFDIAAQVALAETHEDAILLGDTNHAFACFWYQQAARRGHTESQFHVGELLYNGRGISYDTTTTTTTTAAATATKTPNDNRARAIPWFREAAERGHSRAQYYMGAMALNGVGGLADKDEEALRWFRRAATQGHAGAQNNIGWMYDTGRGVAQDYNEAVRWYRQAALSGSMDAHSNMGIMYEYGRGVEQSNTEAVYWYRRGAVQGHASSQFNLGIMYFYGRGVDRDDTEAMAWYRRAADKGEKSAQCNVAWLYNLGRGVEEDDHQSLLWYIKSAAQGCREAEWSLGLMHEVGLALQQDDDKAVEWYHKACSHGVKDLDADTHLQLIEDKRQAAAAVAAAETATEDGVEFDAVEWYRQRAESGDAAASYNLGTIFEKALFGQPKDYEEAAKWFELALQQGHDSGRERLDLMELTEAAERQDVEAMVALAKCYENGMDGTPVDDATSFFWYLRAAKHGHVSAKCHTADMLSYGEGTARDDVQAAAWYYEAALDGDAWAQNELGYLYDDGQLGVPQSDTEAVYWYRQAAQRGHPCGQFNLGNMYHDGRGVEAKSDKEAVYWFRLAADQGDVIAQNNLAWMYDAGRGVEQDNQEAYKWCLQSAQGGCKEAQCAIGIMMELGIGTGTPRVDLEAASNWYRLAAEADDAAAGLHARVIEAVRQRTTTTTTTTVPQDTLAERKEWYRQLAEQGEPAASYNLATLYDKGSGVDRDLAQAITWYKKASEQGHPNAEVKWKTIMEDIDSHSSSSTTTDGRGTK
ncbi:hypothetical protein DFQ26_006471 [Actinomortierella ambigua]|nr:hypothetical protein DFQ26_006471 [Actinomortierella ambigua]